MIARRFFRGVICAFVFVNWTSHGVVCGFSFVVLMSVLVPLLPLLNDSGRTNPGHCCHCLFQNQNYRCHQVRTQEVTS